MDLLSIRKANLCASGSKSIQAPEKISSKLPKMGASKLLAPAAYLLLKRFFFGKSFAVFGRALPVLEEEAPNQKKSR